MLCAKKFLCLFVLEAMLLSMHCTVNPWFLHYERDWFLCTHLLHKSALCRSPCKMFLCCYHAQTSFFSLDLREIDFTRSMVDVRKLPHTHTYPCTRNRLSMSNQLFLTYYSSALWYFSKGWGILEAMVGFRFLLLSNLPTSHVRPRRRRKHFVGG